MEKVEDIIGQKTTIGDIIVILVMIIFLIGVIMIIFLIRPPGATHFFSPNGFILKEILVFIGQWTIFGTLWYKSIKVLNL